MTDAQVKVSDRTVSVAEIKGENSFRPGFKIVERNGDDKQPKSVNRNVKQPIVLFWAIPIITGIIIGHRHRRPRHPHLHHPVRSWSHPTLPSSSITTIRCSTPVLRWMLCKIYNLGQPPRITPTSHRPPPYRTRALNEPTIPINLKHTFFFFSSFYFSISV